MPAHVHPVNVNLEESTDENLNEKPDDSSYHENVRAESSSESSGGWPSNNQSSDNITEISAALIKKQGDYPEFWTKNNSFIKAMELFYSHTRKKNRKDLL